jgi:hypothetical protein
MPDATPQYIKKTLAVALRKVAATLKANRTREVEALAKLEADQPLAEYLAKNMGYGDANQPGAAEDAGAMAMSEACPSCGGKDAHRFGKSEAICKGCGSDYKMAKGELAKAEDMRACTGCGASIPVRDGKVLGHNIPGTGIHPRDGHLARSCPGSGKPPGEGAGKDYSKGPTAQTKDNPNWNGKEYAKKGELRETITRTPNKETIVRDKNEKSEWNPDASGNTPGKTPEDRKIKEIKNDGSGGKELPVKKNLFEEQQEREKNDEGPDWDHGHGKVDEGKKPGKNSDKGIATYQSSHASPMGGTRKVKKAEPGMAQAKVGGASWLKSKTKLFQLPQVGAPADEERHAVEHLGTKGLGDKPAPMHLAEKKSGYTSCKCRDCMETTVSSNQKKPEFCSDCQKAGCSGEGECKSSHSYGGDAELDKAAKPSTPGGGRAAAPQAPPAPAAPGTNATVKKVSAEEANKEIKGFRSIAHSPASIPGSTAAPSFPNLSNSKGGVAVPPKPGQKNQP